MSRINSVSLLETTLQMYGVEQYLPNFKKFGVDAKVLGLLNDEDLKIIGIEEESVRKQLIQQCKNLPRRKENVKCEIDEEFLTSSLKDIDQHLKLLHAHLSICVSRNTTQFSDIKLNKAVNTFLHCVDSFGKEFEIFQNKVLQKENMNKKWKYAAGILTATTVGYIFIQMLRRS